VREIFAALQSVLSPLHGFDKAVFVVEVTRHNIPHKLIGLEPLLGRSLRDPVFEIWVEMYFHALQNTEKLGRGQAGARSRGMDAKLTFRYDREAGILHIDKCPPYPAQESASHAEPDEAQMPS
jgi:hypothetical protein